MLDHVIKDIIAVMKKAPEVTYELLEQQIVYHKSQILLALDAVPREAFEQQMNLLRQVMLKMGELEEKVSALEERHE